MDEVFLCFLFLGMCAFIRMVTVRIHDYLHPLVNKYLSWYAIMFTGIILLYARSMYDVVVFEYVKLHFLDPDHILETLHLFLTHEEDRTELEALAIHKVLRRFSLVGPLIGGVAVMLVTFHVFRFAFAESPKNRAAREIRDMVFMTIGMPAVFSVMALRATIRIWTVMTGSAWLGRDKICNNCKWDHLKTLEMATFNADLGIASAFQFYTVYLFAKLCAYLLQHSKFIKDDGHGMTKKSLVAYKTRLSHAAVQGVYFYVAIGVLRSICVLLTAIASEYPKYAEKAANFQATVLAQTNGVNAFVTMAGVLNMMVIGNLEDIREVIGSANMKFNGTRLLLLVSQIQLTLLQVFTTDSAANQHFKKFLRENPKYADLPIAKWIVSAFDFSSYQASLLHASLLALECLAVALLNLWAWGKSDYVNIIRHASEKANNVYQPLLESNVDVTVEESDRYRRTQS